MDTCSNCGTEIAPGVKFCGECGAKNEPKNEEKTIKPNTQRKHLRKIIAVSLIATAIIAGASASIYFQFLPQTTPGGAVVSGDTENPFIIILSPLNTAMMNVSSITVTGFASDNVALSTIEVKIDDGSYQTATGTSSWSFPVTLTVGMHTITAKATDTAGNFAEKSVIVEISNDTIKPTVAITYPADGDEINSSSIIVTGTASDNDELRVIQVKINEGDWQNASGTVGWSTKVVLINGSNTITAKATDASGNYNTTTVKVKVIVLPAKEDPLEEDTESPTIQITYPESQATVTTASITVTGSASDNVALSTIEVKIDDGSYQTATGTLSWSCPVTLTVGMHTIKAKATDTAGNYATTQVTVTVSDTINPTIHIDHPLPGSKYYVGQTYHIVIDGTASDNIGVSKVEIRLDDGAIQNWVKASYAGGSWSYTFTITLTPIMEGTHRFYARVTDTSGHSAVTYVSVIVMVDTQKPTIAITYPPDGITIDPGSFLVTGSASDNVALSTIEVKIDDGSYQTATGTLSWSFPVTLTVGMHTIKAKATDTAGNYATTQVTVTVSDTIDPTIHIDHPLPGTIYHIGQTYNILIDGTASDNIAVSKVEIRLDKGEILDWVEASYAGGSWSKTFPITIPPNMEGSHRFYARVTDTSGNSATTFVTVSVI